MKVGNGLRQQMDVWFCEGRNHGREARVRAARNGEPDLARSSKARVRRSVIFLDIDYMEVAQVY